MTTEAITVDSVLEESNQPLVTTGERDQLVATLKPLAGMIEKYSHYAEKCVVNTPSDAEVAAAYIGAIANDRKVVENAIKTHKESSRKRWLSWCGLENVFLDPFDKAHKIIKGKAIAWQERERLAALAEQNRLQAIADEAARKEKERLEKLAASRKTEEKKEMYREQAAAVVPSVIHVAPPPKAVKASARWFAKVADVHTLIDAAAKDKSLAGYITVDTTKLARAKSANSLLVVPGIIFESRLV